MKQLNSVHARMLLASRDASRNAPHDRQRDGRMGAGVFHHPAHCRRCRGQARSSPRNIPALRHIAPPRKDTMKRSVPHPPPPDFRRFRDRRKPRFRAAQNHAQSQFCRNFTYCDMCARMCGFCFPLHAKVRIFPYFRVFHPLFTVPNPPPSAMQKSHFTSPPQTEPANAVFGRKASVARSN